MKVKRVKRARRRAQLYTQAFGFREPVRFIVDGTFCAAALENRLNLQEQIPAYLGMRTQLMTTACVVNELVELGEDFRGARLVAKRFEYHRCRCRRTDTGGAAECLKRMIGEDNSLHFGLATQDPEVKAAVCKVPGVPILSITFGQLRLDKPSKATLAHAAVVGQAKVEAPVPVSSTSEAEMDNVKGHKRPDKRRRKKSGPNPLSVKKKRKEKASLGSGKNPT